MDLNTEELLVEIVQDNMYVVLLIISDQSK